MKELHVLAQSLETLRARHHDLKELFLKFSNSVKVQATDKGFQVKEISYSADADCSDPHFVLSFITHSLYFVFSSAPDEGGKALMGHVRCMRKNAFPSVEFTQISSFAFNRQGQTIDLLHPEFNEPMQVDYDVHALHIALHMIDISLSQKPWA